VEAMKLLKPWMERVASGDLASVQAVMKVNAEQAPKRRMQEPTHRSYGEGRRRWKKTSERVPSDLPGYLATACRHRKEQNDFPGGFHGRKDSNRSRGCMSRSNRAGAKNLSTRGGSNRRDAPAECSAQTFKNLGRLASQNDMIKTIRVKNGLKMPQEMRGKGLP
jgi:hypothetical protein